ncbi:MAG: hypothetical protein CO129_07895 [Ignavibacteriales bacterium CG_4_9_14_3_um_filter_34_10]|nr:MAG: hypothetical protein CO129_07895 [Ignavibacteriales bacterium CG_4_9_14_3_um_filter_34_10]
MKINMIKAKKDLIILKLFFCLLIPFVSVFAQQNRERANGEITFISSQHVYVKFSLTDGIFVGDTLFTKKDGVDFPTLIVKFISSRSIAAEKISSLPVSVNDKVFAFRRITEKEKEILPGNENLTEIKDSLFVKNKIEVTAQIKPSANNDFYGRFSVQSISTLDNQSSANSQQRWRYSFSLSGDKIYQSDFSFSSYITYSYNTYEWQTLKKDLTRNLRVYDLGLKYEFADKSFIWAGRHINQKVSNVGTIDGFQYERKASNFSVGGIAGSRPNFYDFSFDPKLFEFGAYVGRIDTIGKSQTENTVAIFQQTNKMKTDRRYLYFQHSNNLLPETYMFLSSEIDLFKIKNGNKQSVFDLTSIFFSARYNFSRELSTSFSYDARKNVIYYETYKTFLDALIENEMRQGYTATVYYRPTSRLFLSANYGYRSQKRDKNSSRNFGANISYYQIPILLLNGTFLFSQLKSSYSTGNQFGIRLNKSLTDEVSLSSEVRLLQYKFASNNYKLSQTIANFEISYQLPWKMYFSINYEGLFYDKISQGRFFIDLTKRF